MVHVVDLDPVEARGGERRYRALGNGVAALGGAGVREDGDSAGRLDEADRVEGVEFVLLDVRASAVGQPVGRKGVGDGLDDAEFHQGGRDVRAADRAVSGDTGHLVPLDRHAQLLELADHGPRAGHPVVPYQLALARQLGLVGVEEVRQHVQPDAVEAAGELGAGDEGHPRRERVECGDRLGVAAGRVVVGERHDVESGRRGVTHQLGRGVRAVRSCGVGVQVDQHDA